VIENLATLNNFFDGIDESWFYLITGTAHPRQCELCFTHSAAVDLEYKGARAIVPIMRMMQAIDRASRGNEQDNDTEALCANVASELEEVRAAIDGMCRSLDRMRDGCYPFIFYHRCVFTYTPAFLIYFTYIACM
jgi:hypothetical protein